MACCDPSLTDLIADLAHQRVKPDTLARLFDAVSQVSGFTAKPTRRGKTMTNPDASADQQVNTQVDNLVRSWGEVVEVVEQLKRENESGVVQPGTIARLSAIVGQVDDAAPPVAEPAQPGDQPVEPGQPEQPPVEPQPAP